MGSLNYKLKKDSIKYLLTKRCDIFFVLDATVNGVKVPPNLKNQSTLGLVLSEEIKDKYFNLKDNLDDKNVYLDLIFNGKKFNCTLPFKSITSILEGRNNQVLQNGFKLIFNRERMEKIDKGKNKKGVITTEGRSKNHLRLINCTKKK